MSEPKLGWETGTVKDKCKCTLQDAARARHCRYCSPQETIDELESELKGEQEDYEELEKDKDKEIAKLREALEAIKKHVELSCPSGHKMSAVWNIANEALNNG